MARSDVVDELGGECIEGWVQPAERGLPRSLSRRIDQRHHAGKHGRGGGGAVNVLLLPVCVDNVIRTK